MTKKTATARARAAVRELTDVPTQLQELAGMKVEELAQRYRELYGEPTRSRNKGYLKKRLGWRIQELSEGGLPPQVIAKVAELGDGLPERWKMRQAEKARAKEKAKEEAAAAGGAPVEAPRDPRLPPVGSVLRREYQGVECEVTVGPEAFEYQGERFKTLSAVARRITGTPWNGYLFFGLTPVARPAKSTAKEATT